MFGDLNTYYFVAVISLDLVITALCTTRTWFNPIQVNNSNYSYFTCYKAYGFSKIQCAANCTKELLCTHDISYHENPMKRYV